MLLHNCFINAFINSTCASLSFICLYGARSCWNRVISFVNLSPVSFGASTTSYIGALQSRSSSMIMLWIIINEVIMSCNTYSLQKRVSPLIITNRNCRNIKWLLYVFSARLLSLCKYFFFSIFGLWIVCITLDHFR